MDLFNNIDHPLFYTDFDKSYYRYKIVGTDIKYFNYKDIYKLWISVKSFIDIYNLLWILIITYIDTQFVNILFRKIDI